MAGFVDDKFIAEVKLRNDLAAVIREYGVVLKPVGRRLKGVCPLHQDSEPSFYVEPQQQFFKCFGCGAGGDVIGFVMQMEKLDFPAALERLAERAGLPMPETDDEAWRARRQARESVYEANRMAGRYYFSTLFSPEGKEGLAYLRSRGLSDGIIRRFGLGYAPKGWDGLIKEAARHHIRPETLKTAGLAQQGEKGLFDLFRGRVMFPIIEPRGQVVGFGGRVLGQGSPKYLNSPATPVFDKHKCLFGLNLAARDKKLPYLILVEGYMDVVSLHQAGITQAVAALGTAFGEDHARLIKRYVKEVYVCFDGDAAGVKAALRSFETLERQGLSVRVLRISDNRDPDDVVRQGGAAAFEREMKNALTVPDFRMLLAREASDMSTSQGRAQFAVACADLLAAIQSPIEREEHLKRWMERLQLETGFSADSLYAEVEQALKRHRITVARPKPAGADTAHVQENAEPVPKAEGELIALLYEGGPAAEQAVAGLQGEDFSHPVCRALFEKRKKAALSVTDAVSDMAEGDKKIALGLFMRDMPGDRARLTADLVAAVRKAGVERQIGQLENRLQQGALTEAQRLEILERIQMLYRQYKA
nr:DNA primase [bacterium]